MNNIQWKIKVLDEKNKIVKLEIDSIKLPTQNEYKEKVEELLGIRRESEKKLISEDNNLDLNDGMLLYLEMNDQKFQELSYKGIVISGPRGDITLKKENYDVILDSMYKSYMDHKVAIQEALEEAREELY